MAGWLEVIDRQTGEVERIPLADGNASVSVATTAERLGISWEEAWATLEAGGSLTTPGFVRRLARVA